MTTTIDPGGTIRSQRAARIAKRLRWAGVAIALVSVVFLFLPVAATVDGHEVSCSPAFTMGFPSDPGPDGLTPTDIACSAAAGNNGLWFLGLFLTGLALIVGTSIWLGRRKRTDVAPADASTQQVPWRRPTDISDTVLLLAALIAVPVLALIAAIAGLPLLAPSDPGPDGVDSLQHEFTIRAITALVCCLSSPGPSPPPSAGGAHAPAATSSRHHRNGPPHPRDGSHRPAGNHHQTGPPHHPAGSSGPPTPDSRRGCRPSALP